MASLSDVKAGVAGAVASGQNKVAGAMQDKKDAALGAAGDKLDDLKSKIPKIPTMTDLAKLGGMDSALSKLDGINGAMGKLQALQGKAAEFSEKHKLAVPDIQSITAGLSKGFSAETLSRDGVRGLLAKGQDLLAKNLTLDNLSTLGSYAAELTGQSDISAIISSVKPMVMPLIPDFLSNPFATKEAEKAELGADLLAAGVIGANPEFTPPAQTGPFLDAAGATSTSALSFLDNSNALAQAGGPLSATQNALGATVSGAMMAELITTPSVPPTPSKLAVAGMMFKDLVGYAATAALTGPMPDLPSLGGSGAPAGAPAGATSDASAGKTQTASTKTATSSLLGSLGGLVGIASGSLAGGSPATGAPAPNTPTASGASGGGLLSQLGGIAGLSGLAGVAKTAFGGLFPAPVVPPPAPSLNKTTNTPGYSAFVTSSGLPDMNKLMGTTPSSVLGITPPSTVKPMVGPTVEFANSLVAGGATAASAPKVEPPSLFSKITGFAKGLGGDLVSGVTGSGGKGDIKTTLSSMAAKVTSVINIPGCPMAGLVSSVAIQHVVSNSTAVAKLNKNINSNAASISLLSGLSGQLTTAFSPPAAGGSNIVVPKSPADPKATPIEKIGFLESIRNGIAVGASKSFASAGMVLDALTTVDTVTGNMIQLKTDIVRQCVPHCNNNYTANAVHGYCTSRGTTVAALLTPRGSSKSGSKTSAQAKAKSGEYIYINNPNAAYRGKYKQLKGSGNKRIWQNVDQANYLIKYVNDTARWALFDIRQTEPMYVSTYAYSDPWLGSWYTDNIGPVITLSDSVALLGDTMNILGIATLPEAFATTVFAADTARQLLTLADFTGSRISSTIKNVDYLLRPGRMQQDKWLRDMVLYARQ